MLLGWLCCKAAAGLSLPEVPRACTLTSPPRPPPPAGIQASLKQGELRLTIPKAPAKAPQPRTIPVVSAAGEDAQQQQQPAAQPASAAPAAEQAAPTESEGSEPEQ